MGYKKWTDEHIDMLLEMADKKIVIEESVLYLEHGFTAKAIATAGHKFHKLSYRRLDKKDDCRHIFTHQLLCTRKHSSSQSDTVVTYDTTADDTQVIVGVYKEPVADTTTLMRSITSLTVALNALANDLKDITRV